MVVRLFEHHLLFAGGIEPHFRFSGFSFNIERNGGSSMIRHLLNFLTHAAYAATAAGWRICAPARVTPQYPFHATAIPARCQSGLPQRIVASAPPARSLACFSYTECGTTARATGAA